MGAVLAKPGIPDLVNALAAATRNFQAVRGPVTVAVGCVGGRYRPVGTALLVA
jgi:RNase adaptor protein for sRNA GlmZ degradation